MPVKAGMWIDHRRAILVLLREHGQDIKQFTSGIEDTGRSTLNNAHASHDFVPEDTLQRKFQSELKNFYDEVIAGLQGSKALLILGPGEAKGEFHKRLESKHVSGLVIEVKAADKMTEGQLVAQIVRHFAAPSSAGSSK